ncbi:MAG TPA: ferritin-like domain-containing protein [Thermoanaerobaculia bacterium]|nr:ferritin-like domain-containing protein [Thermoanaerobaculia bacterium]
MELVTLQALYEHELKDLYSAEKQITKALPKMIRAATNGELAAALRDHLEVTERQIGRLEQIFAGLGKSPRGKKCKGMEGLLDEGADLLKEEGVDPEVLDAGIIASAQRVEHYEIAGYGTVRAYAELLGEGEAVALLDATAKEEGEADKTLTAIANRTVNLSALSPEAEESQPARRRRTAPRASKSRSRAPRKGSYKLAGSPR